MASRYQLYDRVRIEPTDESFLDAITFARESHYDGFVAVGGGSTIDTAKAVNLYTTYPPSDFLDYVNPPIGKGLPIPGTAQTVDRHPDYRRDRERDHRSESSSTSPGCMPRPALPAAA